ncbi:helix-turn-helix domain-containing protein [Eubacterium sp.]|uniref:helix-turn-helix domain-containing protein n=1 Tax=Eubacterium sp. TaxID=142586 RepID=UPI0025CC4929|nr:helix-turn-helix domain-containing protein [Eubacterium sp.]MCR5630084.1 helix-turn-helix domain-containing protein [Eubacterium sp.]
MTLADKLKEARKNAGLTQVELAEKLCVSRQAITKWESGKGIPDVENLKNIANVLNVSIDFLLDDEGTLDKTIIKEQINLNDYVKEGKLRSKKDAVVYAKYPDADITPLLAKKKSSKGQKVFAELLGILTDAPFGTDEVFNQIADARNAYYLVQEEGKQIFVTVTEDFIESKVMAKEIVGNKFEIGDYKFQKANYKVKK